MLRLLDQRSTKVVPAAIVCGHVIVYRHQPEGI